VKLRQLRTSMFLLLLVGLALISFSKGQPTSMMLVYTTTYVTTFVITFNYVTIMNGTTVVGGYLTTTSLTVTATMTSISGNSTSSSQVQTTVRSISSTTSSTSNSTSGSRAIVAYPIESVILGFFFGGLLIFTVRRRHKRQSGPHTVKSQIS
jgi:hypothetical protein